ncbi:MAG: hypothetical protein IPP22_10580 [Nitrosomonas sp.]|nr:hypothetical protein [Nitrosomonas sp.]
MNNRSLMDRLIQYTIVNENHLHLFKISCRMANIQALSMNIPQQSARLSVRSRMVASTLFSLIKPSAPSSSFGVLGFSLAVVS